MQQLFLSDEKMDNTHCSSWKVSHFDPLVNPIHLIVRITILFVPLINLHWAIGMIGPAEQGGCWSLNNFKVPPNMKELWCHILPVCLTQLVLYYSKNAQAFEESTLSWPHECWCVTQVCRQALKQASLPWDFARWIFWWSVQVTLKIEKCRSSHKVNLFK